MRRTGTHLYAARKEHAPRITQRRVMSKMGSVRVVDVVREGMSGNRDGKRAVCNTGRT